MRINHIKSQQTKAERDKQANNLKRMKHFNEKFIYQPIILVIVK